MPYGVCEYEVIGGIRGKPVEVVKAPITGLPFPANAEIVIEGFVEPGNVRREGPFGEWTGYYASDMRHEPVIDIKAIYHRNNPILLGCAPQRPPDEIARYRAVDPLGARAREYRQGRRARRHRGLGARDRHGAAAARRSPSSSAIRGHAKQAGHVAASVMSAPMPGATSSSSTTTSTCPISKR